MGYTVKELLLLIDRHDQHEAYYREKLIETIKGERRFTWAIQLFGLRNGIAMMLVKHPLSISEAVA